MKKIWMILELFFGLIIKEKVMGTVLQILEWELKSRYYVLQLAGTLEGYDKLADEIYDLKEAIEILEQHAEES